MPPRRDPQTPASKATTLRPDRRLLTALQVGVDLLALILAFALSYCVYTFLIVAGSWYSRIPDITPYLPLIALFGVIALLAFWHLGLYRVRSTVLNLWELQAVPQGIAAAAAFFFAILFFLKLEGYSRVVVVGAIAASVPLLILERRMLAVLTRHLKLRGLVGTRVLIYGSGSMGRLLMKKIVQAPGLCRTVIGFLDDNEPPGTIISCRLVQDGSLVFQAAVLGHSRELEGVIEQHGVDELLIIMPTADRSQLPEILDLCTTTGTSVGVVPQMGEMRADRLAIEDLSAIPVLRPRGSSKSTVYHGAKRVMDIVISAVLIIFATVFAAVAAFLIKLDSPGPVFFIQERIGLNGRRFRMYKFRTMRVDTDPYAPSPSGDVHPDITRVGRLLRIGGMDELPQLINVILGDMSLVGPRPEMPFIVEGYGPLERERLTVKPGITGVWQLSADRHSEIHENLEYDLYYVSHASIMLDSVILIETVLFTVGVFVGGLWRRGVEAPAVRVQAEARNGRGTRIQSGAVAQSVASSTGAAHSLASDPYVLIALDQRRNGTVPPSWQSAVPAAYALSSRCRVKTLVAATNVEFFDRLLNEPAARLGTLSYRTEYSLYGSLAELRALICNAILVVTDLEHVSAMARDGNVDTVILEPHGSRWISRSHSSDRVIDTLAQIMPLVSERTPDLAGSAQNL
jgi:exopolysaccharide biosynthesis polyprenyl glycosylphosphotransferase